jgi:hypothetical protein
MINNNYDFTVYEYLKKNIKLCYLTTDKSETYIRCPYCGDSTNLNHAHLYINNQPPFKYFCQKCSVTGIVDNKFLRDIDLYDPEVINYVVQSKNNYIKNLNKKYGNNFLEIFNKNFDVLPNQYNKKELEKIKYINNRLGININEESLIEKYKIILNIEDFFNNNKLQMNQFYKKNLSKLENNYVGFLLNDNNMICFRDITGKQNERYINKKIYSENILQSRKFYTIGNEINLSREVYNIYLAEGIFDILGIFNHLYDCKQNDNDLFISCNGKSYNFVLKYLQTLGILNCNINIFSDKDVSKKKIIELLHGNYLTKFNGVTLYYNNIGKDYGVTKLEIELSNPIEI